MKINENIICVQLKPGVQPVVQVWQQVGHARNIGQGMEEHLLTSEIRDQKVKLANVINVCMISWRISKYSAAMIAYRTTNPWEVSVCQV